MAMDIGDARAPRARHGGFAHAVPDTDIAALLGALGPAWRVVRVRWESGPGAHLVVGPAGAILVSSSAAGASVDAGGGGATRSARAVAARLSRRAGAVVAVASAVVVPGRGRPRDGGRGESVVPAGDLLGWLWGLPTLLTPVECDRISAAASDEFADPTRIRIAGDATGVERESPASMRRELAAGLMIVAFALTVAAPIVVLIATVAAGGHLVLAV